MRHVELDPRSVSNRRFPFWSINNPDFLGVPTDIISEQETEHAPGKRMGTLQMFESELFGSSPLLGGKERAIACERRLASAQPDAPDLHFPRAEAIRLLLAASHAITGSLLHA